MTGPVTPCARCGYQREARPTTTLEEGSMNNNTRRDALAFQLTQADPDPYEGEHPTLYYRLFASALLAIQEGAGDEGDS